MASIFKKRILDFSFLIYFLFFLLKFIPGKEQPQVSFMKDMFMKDMFLIFRPKQKNLVRSNNKRYFRCPVKVPIGPILSTAKNKQKSIYLEML